MFLRYALHKENGKVILYLYKTTQFEFAKEFSPNVDTSIKTLEEEAVHYIKEKKLPTSFDKIYILVDGKIVKTLPKEQVLLEMRTLERRNQDEAKSLISIYKDEKQEKVSLFNYLMGSLFTNNLIPLKKEALKAIVILYRTYAIDCVREIGFVDANSPFLTYRDPLLYKLIYLEKYQETYELFKKAILETQGLCLFSNGTLVKPYVHLVSSGYTKEKEGVSYLIAKESLWDMKAKNYLQQFFFSYQSLEKKLKISKEKLQKIQLFNQDTLQFEEQKISKKGLSSLLKLPSCEFTCIEEKEGLTFLCRGIGSDLGLSIYGANYLAEQGFTYDQILAYYFQNILLYKL